MILMDAHRESCKRGTRVGRARDFLQTIGRPASIDEIAAAIGEDKTFAHRHILGKSLSNYARKGKVFLKKNVSEFGLLPEKESQPQRRKNTPEMVRAQNRARKKVNRQILAGGPVTTPTGKVYDRPKKCQWCARVPRVAEWKNTPIEAYHFAARFHLRIPQR